MPGAPWRPMRLLPRLAPALLLTTGLAACGPAQGQKTPLPMSEARSQAERLPPDASLESVRQLAKSEAAFALDLLRAIPDEGNTFYSPHSISTALAMTYAGALGETKEQMAKVLHFAQPDAELNAAFNTLDQVLESRGQGAKGADGQPFRLRIANALWAQQGHAFLPRYLDTLAEDYGAGVRLLDFVRDTEGARNTINGWVSERTEARIPELLPKGILDRDTRFVLTNAVYFNAAWARPFAPEQTKEGPFTLADGSQVRAPLMHGRLRGRYGEGSDFMAAEIAYQGAEVAMLAVLPRAAAIADFEKTLDARKLDEIVESLGTAELDLTLPRFEIRTPLALADLLKGMGMPDAFTPGLADFSAMDGSRDLYLQNAVHEAFVKVNEAGTEAAAATAVIGGLASQPELHAFEATRPFLFFIRDIETGASLFVGRVANPAE